MYSLPSALSMTSSMPSYAERFQVRSSPRVRCEAKPVPPRVLVSRVPWNLAIREDAEQVSSDCEEPPRTRSSEAVQSFGDQALWEEVWFSIYHKPSQSGSCETYRTPPKRGRWDVGAIL